MTQLKLPRMPLYSAVLDTIMTMVTVVWMAQMSEDATQLSNSSCYNPVERNDLLEKRHQWIVYKQLQSNVLTNMHKMGSKTTKSSSDWRSKIMSNRAQKRQTISSTQKIETLYGTWLKDLRQSERREKIAKLQTKQPMQQYSSGESTMPRKSWIVAKSSRLKKERKLKTRCALRMTCSSLKSRC